MMLRTLDGLGATDQRKGQHWGGNNSVFALAECVCCRRLCGQLLILSQYIDSKLLFSSFRHVDRAPASFTGQYVPADDGKYVHVSDRRERGKYVHIPFPYDGGYGPYDGVNGLPYEFDPAGDYRYAHDTHIKTNCLQFFSAIH